MHSYDVLDVTDGATLSGSVTLQGDVPSDEIIKVTEDMGYCGEQLKVGKYLVSDSKIKNAVVWLEGIGKGKEIPDSTVNVFIDKCQAKPHVSVGFVGGEYLFRNDDPILHTVQLKLGLAYQKQVSSRPLKDGATIYNLALPRKGLEITKPIKSWHRYADDKGFVQIRSNTHNWIRAYVFIFDHPYAAVTDDSGSFTLDDIPPGEYVIRAWHEGFGVKVRKVKVTPGETFEIEFVFDN